MQRPERTGSAHKSIIYRKASSEISELTRPIDQLTARLAAGGLLLLDGATGTELQRRGVRMHSEAWCATATLTDPEILLEVHRDYILAGADIITTNTFSTNRSMLEPAGLGDRLREINRAAVQLALKARELASVSRPVAVAGSMSHQAPVVAGCDFRDPEAVPDRRTSSRQFSGDRRDPGGVRG